MPNTQGVTNNHEYRNIPIATLVESPTNPRKRFDERTLGELAASFKTQGVLEPLLVRPLEETKYEVVIGARRLKAARLAELESVPVRVVTLTDAEAIEAQVVENLQREDIHPLEESLGFKALMQLGEPTYTIASIAARAGKSEAYVQGRIKLADLIPSVAEAFLKDTIAIGHALLIAKLPDSQQQEAFNAAFRGMWTSAGNQQVLIPVRELAAWIESNILLQLASAPFDKQDETLVPAVCSCGNCPKRTGFNKLLFADVRKDSCTDPQCFRTKIDAHVAKTLEAKPQLVQISSAWNTREAAPLGRSRYVELEIKKPKPNGTGAKLASHHKPCDKMTEAVVMDGGRRGELVKICADLSCRVHHPDTPSPEQVAKERADERKRIEKNKLAITTRHYVLAKMLERVSAPLKKTDLLTLAQYTIANLSYNQVPALAKRHKVDTAKTTKLPQEVLTKKVSTYDEAALSRLLVEISLLDSAYQRGNVSQDLLLDAAKRYRVDVEKIEKAVAAEFAAKRAKKTQPKVRTQKKTAASG
ncbi:MAG: parB-like partition protein [Candidatus Sulfotelmatobacter sp.]|nr:parB-like partition protein [Candidatus Sulfotelmatobacter sp.]